MIWQSEKSHHSLIFCAYWRDIFFEASLVDHGASVVVTDTEFMAPYANPAIDWLIDCHVFLKKSL